MVRADAVPFGLLAGQPIESIPKVSEPTSLLPEGLQPVSSRFPLGRAFGMLPADGAPTPAAAWPFGLRLSRTHPVIEVGDTSAYLYDPVRQVGVVREGDGFALLARHSTGQTQTVTNPDGRGGPDRDTDHTED